MSLTPAVAKTLRQALATVVVVPVTPLLADGNPDWAAYTTLTRRADNVSVVKEARSQLGLCRADVRPPSRLLPDPVKQEISAMLTSWGLA